MKLMTLILLLGSVPYAAMATPANEPALPSGAKTVALLGSCANPAPVCDGVVDDTCELQVLLDHDNPEMTVVEIPATPKGCRISNPLYVQSNTHVIQNGLIMLNGYTWPMPAEQVGMYTLLDGTHDVIIEGSGVLDGAHPNYLVRPDGCCIGGIVSGESEVGGYDVEVNDITIRGLTIRNIATWPLLIDGAHNLLVDGITAHDAVTSAAIGHDSSDVIVNNLRVSRILDVCFAFYRGVENALITNSIVDQCDNGAGISVYSDQPEGIVEPRFSKHIVLNNNIAYGARQVGNTGGIDVNGFDHDSGVYNDRSA